jgi:hypothetical protein
LISDRKRVTALKTLLSEFIDKLKLPAIEVAVHFVVTVLAVVSIALTEQLLHALGMDGKIIPAMGLPLGEWMFMLEVAAATVIIAVGVIKAAIALWKE